MPTSIIIDNRDCNTFLFNLANVSTGGTEPRTATAFSSVDALLRLADYASVYPRLPIRDAVRHELNWTGSSLRALYSFLLPILNAGMPKICAWQAFPT